MLIRTSKTRFITLWSYMVIIFIIAINRITKSFIKFSIRIFVTSQTAINFFIFAISTRKMTR